MKKIYRTPCAKLIAFSEDILTESKGIYVTDDFDLTGFVEANFVEAN